MVPNDQHHPKEGAHRRRAHAAGAGEAQPQTQGNGASQPSDAETIEGLQAQISEERNRADGYLEQWKRASADFQNLKRRTEQEREEYTRLANTALLLNVLPAIDDLDRALATVDESIKGEKWVEGIEAIQRKLKGALEASGLTEIPAEGEEFDPNVHEAVSQAPGEHNKVIAVARPGYKLGNRVIRPALVVVGSGD